MKLVAHLKGLMTGVYDQNPYLNPVFQKFHSYKTKLQTRLPFIKTAPHKECSDPANQLIMLCHSLWGGAQRGLQ